MIFLEPPMTKGFWQSVARGTYIPEYPLVSAGKKDRGCRRADAVILSDEPYRQTNDYHYSSLEGRNVIVVQTKKGRMGMHLMGQTLFSARLAVARGAASVRSILLCHETDGALLPLLPPFPEVEVWLSDVADPAICHRVPIT